MLLRLLVLVMLVALPAAAIAETRVALVIGNSSYVNAPALPNPVNDASDVGTMLSGLGFDVTTALDLDGQQFDQTLSNFRRKVEGADVAIFFYAGHGLQFDEENYLVPIDAQLSNEFSVQRETTGLRQVVGLMEGAKISLIFLDACRNNPLATELARSLNQLGRSTAMGQGLAAPPLTGRDVLIAFAAAPDQVAFDGQGRNSPFTSAILAHLPTPNIEISTALKRVTSSVRDATEGKQLPQQLTDMATEFYMGGLTDVAPAPTPAPPVTLPAIDPEEEAFRTAASANTAAAWAAFLEAFPEGRYAPVARVSLAALAPQKEEPPPIVVADLPAKVELPPAEEKGGNTQLISAGDQALLDALDADIAVALEAGDRDRHNELRVQLAGLRYKLGVLEGVADLAYYYAIGQGVAQDVPAAISMFNEAIARRSAVASYNFGWMLNGRPGFKEDFEESARLILQALTFANESTDAQLLKDLVGHYELLDEAVRKSIQTRLREQKLYDGESHGTFNLATQRALEAYAKLTIEQEDWTVTQPAASADTAAPAPDPMQTRQLSEAANKRGDHAEAFKLLTAGLDQKDPWAMGQLAPLYLSGQEGVVKQNVEYGLALYEAAVAGGDYLATMDYGFMLDKGLAGVPRDPARSAELLLIGLKAEPDADAEYHIEMLERVFLERDTLLEMHSRLVEEGVYPDASRSALSNGFISSTMREALEIHAGLRSAVSSGGGSSADAAATRKLFQEAWDTGEYEDAIAFLETNVDAKDPRSMGQLATFLSLGTMVKRDVERALTLYEAAVAGGDVASMFALAQLLDDGGEGAVEPQQDRAAQVFLEGLTAAPNYLARAHLSDLYRLGEAYFSRETRSALQVELKQIFADETGTAVVVDGTIGPSSRRALENHASVN